MPDEVREIVNDVVGVSGLRERVRIAWLKNAGGHVGFFSPPGLVALGEKDLKDLSERVFYGTFTPMPREAVPYHHPSHVRTLHQTWRACVQYVVGHEIGHVRQYESGATFPSSIDCECDADVWPGVLGDYFDWDARLHTLIAEAIGCDCEMCAHPTGQDRVACNAYGWHGGRQPYLGQFSTSWG